MGCIDPPVVSLYSTLFSSVNLQKFGWQGFKNITIFGIVNYNFLNFLEFTMVGLRYYDRSDPCHLLVNRVSTFSILTAQPWK